MSEYPKIWDRSGPRKIVGETRVSWILEHKPWDRNPDKVNKKNPNGRHYHPKWFFSESDREDQIYKERNQWRIGTILQRSEINIERLRQIAGWIGYEEEGTL